MNEELGLLHRSKELQEGEMQRLRKGMPKKPFPLPNRGHSLHRLSLAHQSNPFVLPFRSDNESLRKERDKMNARILELNQAAESAKSTVTVQDMST